MSIIWIRASKINGESLLVWKAQGITILIPGMRTEEKKNGVELAQIKPINSLS
jgi:hypothetical protein